MGWTKRQLIAQAFDEIGLAEYFFDLTPEQLISACVKLDAMVASWGGLCVRIGYAMADSPETTNIDTDSGLPDWANEAIYLNLALRIGRSIGKPMSPERRADARAAYLNLLNANMPPIPEIQMPSTMPRGAGQKYWRGYNNPFFPTPCDPVYAGPDRPLLEP